MGTAVPERVQSAPVAPSSGPTTPTTPASAQDPQRMAMLAAAEARAAARPQGVSAEKAQELAVKAQKQELMGRIKVQLKRLGEDEPFGLGARSIPALQQYLRDVTERKVLPRGIVKT